MDNLKCRTFRDLNPQGKEHVYFTCYPEDFERYFEEICTEIFITQDCAIYYKENMNEEWDINDIETELESMKLFVIPVTERFLSQDNLARNVELPFAEKHHIPVLPLIMEKGLDNSFNEKCGDLQFVDMTLKDNNVLLFTQGQKLEQFLSSVLLDDELVQRVREEFSAYIFISYRKKDIKYVQELMSMIHEIEICRDVAIWYDDFLVPGENFDNSIDEIIKKSPFFVLVITPNILEKDNYVMKEEYPDAIRYKKIILPIEMEETDREQLCENYKDLPDITYAYDHAAFSKLFSEQFGSAITINNDPEHLYYIGLAYLNGIDVEVNYPRALELITTAANNDLPEAMFKLFQMYQIGEGVRIDLKEAASWLGKVVAYLQNEFDSNCVEEDGYKLVKCLRELGRTYKEIPDMELAGKAYKNGLSIAEDMMYKFNNDKNISNLIFGYNQMGEFYMSNRQFKNAKKDFVEALKLNAKLKEKTNDNEIIIIQTQILLGNIYEEEGKCDKARKWYMDSFNQSEEISDRTKDVNAKRLACSCCESLGDLSQDEGKIDDAGNWYYKSLVFGEDIAGVTKSNDDIKYICIGHIRLGQVAQLKNKLKDAENEYLNGLDICRNLIKIRETEELRELLSSCYYNLAKVYFDMKKYEKSRTWYMKCKELSERLVKEAGTAKVSRDLSICYADLGILSETEHKSEEAYEWYQKSLELRKRIDSDKNSGTYYDDLAFLYYCMGGGLLITKKFDVSLLTKAEQIWEYLEREYPQISSSKRNLKLVREAINIAQKAN